LHIFHQPNQKGVWRAFKRGWIEFGTVLLIN
jgi:hypothetical protein